jgi:hypothetical protein
VFTHMHPRNTGLLHRSIRMHCFPIYQAQVLMGAQNVPAMAESPFAPSRRYLSGSSVYRHLGQRYPTLIAPTDSCANPDSSANLHFGSVGNLCRLL